MFASDTGGWGDWKGEGRGGGLSINYYVCLSAPLAAEKIGRESVGVGGGTVETAVPIPAALCHS
jgi:hypothetical protein